MKTQKFSKNLIIIFTLFVLLMSVLTFSACGKKEFEPKELTTEQAQKIVNDAIEKAKTATNIFIELDDEYAYADVEGFYRYEEGGFRVSTSGTSGETVLQEWYIYESSEWILYEYTTLTTGEFVRAEKSSINEDATTYVELSINKEISSFLEEYEGYTETITGIQTAENVYKVSFKYVDEEYGDETIFEFEIIDEYIKKIKVTYSYEGESESEVVNCEYNITDKDIPSLPDVEWTEWE